jgi:ribonuclease G
VDREIIINSAPYETRAAIIEGRRTVEVFIERSRARGVTGNIYKGRVTRVLPGMQAAFVDIGLEKAAYLHGSDLYSAVNDEVPGRGAAPLDLDVDPPSSRPPKVPSTPIEDRVKSGQEVLVQVAKPPVGTKGARVTSMITLPGRHLVFTPTSRRVGVSRRIENDNERRRLKEIVQIEGTEEGGFIIRTACADLTKRAIQEDIRFLRKLWRKILQKSETVSPATLVHYDMDVVLRVVRDLFTAETRRVVVDDVHDYQRIHEFLDTVMPRLKSRVQLYEEPQPIFERFGIEPQINKALERKVWLKSGGYIVLDQTEALTVVDVNTGRFVGKKSQEETILRTNLEAVRTIVDQLRLRNVGGLIVVDLIDMDDATSQHQVFDSLREAMRRDKARSKLLAISEFGLIEMTRKRTRPSLSEILCAPGPTCGSKGRVKSHETIAYEILRRLRREAMSSPAATQIHVGAHPGVIRFLEASEAVYLRNFEADTGRKVILMINETLEATSYQVSISEVAA